MTINKSECPNCGANISSRSSNEIHCEYCGSLIIFESKKSDFQKKSQPKLTKYNSENGLLSVNVYSKVKSIKEVIDLLKNEDISLNKVNKLNISNNSISDLNKLTDFNSLESLILYNNQIENLDDEIIDFLKESIYRSNNFGLDISKNDIIEASLISILKTQNKLSNPPSKYIQVPILENLAISIKKETEDARRKYERSEQSETLRKSFKNFDKYLESIKSLSELEYKLYNELNKREYVFKKQVTIKIDKSPFDLGINEYFEQEDSWYFKYIQCNIEMNLLINVLKEKTGYNASLLIDKIQKRETKMKNDKTKYKLIYVAVSFIFIQLTIHFFKLGGWGILFGIITAFATAIILTNFFIYLIGGD